MSSNLLRKQHCKPCEGFSSAFSAEEVQKHTGDVPEWTASADSVSIERTFTFKNFAEAMVFTNRVGEIAEEENHHPDIAIHDYKKVTISLTTHAIDGLSKNDFIVASKIDGL